MTRTIKVEADAFDAGTIRVNCANNMVAVIVRLCENQENGHIGINSEILGQALYGIELLLHEAETLLSKTVSEVE